MGNPFSPVVFHRIWHEKSFESIHGFVIRIGMRNAFNPCVFHKNWHENYIHTMQDMMPSSEDEELLNDTHDEDLTSDQLIRKRDYAAKRAAS